MTLSQSVPLYRVVLKSKPLNEDLTMASADERERRRERDIAKAKAGPNYARLEESIRNEKRYRSKRNEAHEAALNKRNGVGLEPDIRSVIMREHGWVSWPMHSVE